MIFELFDHADSFTKPMTPQQTAALDTPPLVQVNDTPPHNNQMNLGAEQQNMDFGTPPSPDDWQAAPAGQFEKGGQIGKAQIGKEVNLKGWQHETWTGNAGKTPAELKKLIETVENINKAGSHQAIVTEDEKGYYIWKRPITQYKQKLIHI